MADKFEGKKNGTEGYVYNSYGDIRYLKFAVASVNTLRRYDSLRPAAIFCTQEHADQLKTPSLSSVFDHIYILPEENQSITGFKHNIHKFMPFEKNIFLDSDIVVCREVNRLWKSFSVYGFTVTGNHTADNFFGGPKGFGVITDILMGRRKRTLQRFGLTYLPRVQTGVIYASEYAETREVCEKAQEILSRKSMTHFRSRTEEKGRSEESCEWSLAMAMAMLKKQVYPWFNSYESVQLDFIESFTQYEEDFESVSCLYYTNKFIYNFRGFPVKWLQKAIIKLLTSFPGKGDFLYVTPYFLHFGWYHQKKPFFEFSDKIWRKLNENNKLTETQI